MEFSAKQVSPYAPRMLMIFFILSLTTPSGITRITTTLLLSSRGNPIIETDLWRNLAPKSKLCMHLSQNGTLGLVIYNPAVGGWSNSKWHNKHFEPPSQSQKILFDPPTWKMNFFYLPQRKGFPYNQATKKFFNPPQKKFMIFQTPLKQASKFFDPPLSSRPSLYCG